jgi:hypothetical protein
MKKYYVFTSIFVLVSALSIRAQGVDQNCDPIAVPVECQQSANAVDSLNTRIARLQERLNGASPAAKETLLQSIRRLNSDLETAQSDLRRCIREHGATPRELAANELIANVTGKARMDTTSDTAPGPHYAENLDFDITFSRNRCRVTVTRFPRVRIMTERIRNVGRIEVTVTKVGDSTGAFHPLTSAMNFSIRLHFHYDHPLAPDDDATFSLSTDRSITLKDGTVVSGYSVNNEGNFRLVGSGKFRNGILAGSDGTLVIRGTMTPRP